MRSSKTLVSGKSLSCWPWGIRVESGMTLSSITLLFARPLFVSDLLRTCLTLPFQLSPFIPSPRHDMHKFPGYIKYSFRINTLSKGQHRSIYTRSSRKMDYKNKSQFYFLFLCFKKQLCESVCHSKVISLSFC